MLEKILLVLEPDPHTHEGLIPSLPPMTVEFITKHVISKSSEDLHNGSLYVYIQFTAPCFGSWSSKLHTGVKQVEKAWECDQDTITKHVISKSSEDLHNGSLYVYIQFTAPCFGSWSCVDILEWFVLGEFTVDKLWL